MESQIDYSQYSLDDLLSARETIDEQAYPERVAELDRLIALHSEAPAQDAAEAKVVREGKVQFHGNAVEFFQIWIVNLLLTIVTLGIYSAWAKVKNNRYLYSNTDIDGHRFSYLAQPLDILKGRIIAVVILSMYVTAANLSPAIAGGLILVMLLVSPLLVCLSLRFNMRMTSYRNIRFGFTGTYGKALLTFTVYPILTIFTLYLAMPWALKKIDEFILTHTKYGDTAFTTHLSKGNYFATFFFTGIIGAAILGLSVFLTAAVVGEPNLEDRFSLPFVFMMLGYLVAFTVAGAVYTALIRNHMYEVTQLPQVARFQSEVSAAKLAWIRLTNLLAMFVTLGLAIPWAKVRVSKFLADSTTVYVLEGADRVVADVNAEGSATGDEVASAFDMDIAIG